MLRPVDCCIGMDRDCLILSVEELGFSETLVVTYTSTLSNIAENCNRQHRCKDLTVRTPLCDSAL